MPIYRPLTDSNPDLFSMSALVTGDVRAYRILDGQAEVKNLH